MGELGIVPYASYVETETLQVVDQGEGQDTVPVVDHEVGWYAIVGLVVVVENVAAAVADTGRDEHSYTMVGPRREWYLFRTAQQQGLL